MTETWAQEAERLKREIAERQMRLRHLVLGDQSKGVSIPVSETVYGSSALSNACDQDEGA